MSHNESGFSKNFKVPKRKADSDYSSPYENSERSLLANSYYNYGNQGQWQQGATYTQYPTLYPPTQYPTTRFTPHPVEPITQNICKTLSSFTEKPKIFRKDIFKETVPDVDDSSLPKELTILFQPLYCKLCMAQLSSNIMAKLHYKSKNHEKKIRKFLIDYSEQTGEPLHKRAKMVGPPKTEEEKNPKWFYCEVCDLQLTGKMHAESHYMGKNHQKALLGYKAPAGKGFYDSGGKWVRQAIAKKVLKDGEDTFGLDFRTKKSPEPEEVIPSSSSANPQSKFHCGVCNVGATCQEQIDMHFKGQKHQKKLKQLGMLRINVESQNDTPKPAATQDPTKTIDNINLSVYRTPSGGFYCHTCNLSLISELQFKIHLKSKGHMKRSQKQ